MIGFGDCESLFARLRNKKAIAEKYSARNFLGIQQSLGSNELDNVYWLPGTDSPADGLTEVESDMVPLLHVFKSGTFRPGILGPLRGISSREGGGARRFFFRCVAPLVFGLYLLHITHVLSAANSSPISCAQAPRLFLSVISSPPSLTTWRATLLN